VVNEMKVKDRVKEIIAELFEIEEEKVTGETRFVEDLHAKSINIIEMIAIMEEEFNIEINSIRARRNRTVDQTVDYISSLLKC
jgi:acyl carrier protein